MEASDMAKGQTYSSEAKALKDEQTDAAIRQMTDHPAISHNLYFSNPSWISDGKTIVFTSYRSGHPNLFKMDENSGEMTQLTDMEGFGGVFRLPGQRWKPSVLQHRWTSSSRRYRNTGGIHSGRFWRRPRGWMQPIGRWRTAGDILTSQRAFGSGRGEYRRIGTPGRAQTPACCRPCAGLPD